MKIMIKLFAIVALLAMTASCVTTTTAPSALPEKYNLGNDLKEVKSISAINPSNWTQVDKQSLIFTANGSFFYLVILDKPLETDITNKVVGIVGQKSPIFAGSDKFFIRTAKDRQYYLIEKIYELAGRDQAKQMKEKLSK